MRTSNRELSVTQQMACQWQGSQSTDTVVISVWDATDNTQDISLVAMTHKSGGLFNYAWTPSEEHTYVMDYFNQTLDSHEYETVVVYS